MPLLERAQEPGSSHSLRSSQTPALRMLEEALAPVTHKSLFGTFKLRRGGGGWGWAALSLLTETEEKSVHTHSKR